MKVYLFFILILFVNASLAQQNNQTVEPGDTALATYLRDQFYAENFVDSCYNGIHLLEISFSSRSVSIFISGNLDTVYKNRIIKLVSDPLKIWDRRFVKYCKKKKIHIVQPILFAINANCAMRKMLYSTDKISDSDTLDKLLLKEVTNRILVSQSLSLTHSFEQIRLEYKGKAPNTQLVAPCVIRSRPNNRKKDA